LKRMTSMRDLAAEQDFMQFGAGVARVYRTSVPVEEVFSFYEEKLDASPEVWAEMTSSGSAHASSASGNVSDSVAFYGEGEESARPQLEVRRAMRRARFSWTGGAT
jgi:hypothetical protein